MRHPTQDLPLHEMISSVINNAKVKLAEDEGEREKVKNLLRYERKEHGHIPTEKEEEAEKKEKTASGWSNPDFLEKLASALDTIADAEIESVQPGPLRQALSKVAAKDESPKVTQAIGGAQQYTKDKPKGEDAATAGVGTPLQKAGLSDGKNQMPNNDDQAPGGGGGSVPTAGYPAKGPLVNMGKTASVRDFYQQAVQGSLTKEAFAVTDAGHKMDAARYNAAAKANHEIGPAIGEYKKERPLLAGLQGFSPHRARRAARHYDYAAKKHEEGKNAWNPFGGLLTKSRYETGEEGEKGKEKSASDLAREHILMKLAGEDVMPANISALRDASPLAGGGTLKVVDSEQSGSDQPGGPKGAYGNEARGHIANNDAAIRYTKRDAKTPVKKQLAELLTHPAFSGGRDTKLSENLRNADSAGVKIAAARASLQKIASGGCQCGGQGSCGFCNLQNTVNALQKEKVAQMGGMGGAMPPSPMGGGGMSAMAEGGVAPDGCTCGHAGECRVCKLKAMLSAAQEEAAGGGGSGEAMPEKDSMMPGTY